MITDSVQGAVARRRRILVVDDIEDSRDLYAFYLNHVGYHVTVALDGETAIQLAQQQRFDVIVMDLSMPKMDGVEATRRLKTDERTRQIPIIIVSGHAMQGLAGAARAAGAEGYCMKPCSPETLEREIERVLAGGWLHGLTEIPAVVGVGAPGQASGCAGRGPTRRTSERLEGDPGALVEH